MGPEGILHLTVDRNGKVRIWSTAREAMSQKAMEETAVQLALTTAQMSTIYRAQESAKKRSA